jgi:flagellar biosynthesis chaperone FliJ
MEILVLKLTNLRNEEHYKFNLDFMGLVSQYTPATLGIELKYPAYLSAFGKEELALNIVRGSAVTEELSDADGKRDTTCSGMTGNIKSFLNHYNAEVQKSAKRLTLLLDSYGNLTIKPYDQETASIIKLVAELEGAYAADVTALGIAGWVQELKAQNLAFDNLKKQRYDENTAKSQQNLKEARLETDAYYRAIVKRIEALIEVNGDTAYAPFVNDLNQRIENYQHVLAVRQGRNAKEEDEGGADGEAAPKK